MLGAVLGQRLAACRRRAGFTQATLATALGKRYNRQMISHVENGRSAMLVDGLAGAARALAVSTDYLLGLTDDPTPADELAGGRPTTGPAPRDESMPPGGGIAAPYGLELFESPAVTQIVDPRLQGLLAVIVGVVGSRAPSERADLFARFALAMQLIDEELAGQPPQAVAGVIWDGGPPPREAGDGWDVQGANVREGESQ